MSDARTRVLNYGSLNIDHVYEVDHIALPGETLASAAYRISAGGKGANQSAALARAGATVFHAGCVGPDGGWLLDNLARIGVDVSLVKRADSPTGHAVIQVDPCGENAIVLYPGTNHKVTAGHADEILNQFGEMDILLLQNEISEIPYLISQAHARGMRVYLNPAPLTPEVSDYPLSHVDMLIANQAEAIGLAGMQEAAAEPGDVLDELARRLPGCELVLTLGARGARYRGVDGDMAIDAFAVRAVDTTGAGDTFIGYLVAGINADLPMPAALRQAAAAAALACTREGATDSIPRPDEVGALLATSG